MLIQKSTIESPSFIYIKTNFIKYNIMILYIRLLNLLINISHVINCESIFLLSGNVPCGTEEWNVIIIY